MLRKWVANVMGTNALTLASLGWYLTRLASTTATVGVVVFGVTWFLYEEVVRGFETTFAQLNSSVSDIRADMRHVRQSVDSVDERTAERFRELFAKNGVLEVSLTGDIGKLTGEIRVTNERLQQLASDIESTNTRLADEIDETNERLTDLHDVFRQEMQIQGDFRNTVIQYIGKER